MLPQFFTLIVQPPERVAPAEATPKELVFVLDTSGSMMGFPIEKAKEVVRLALASMNPHDTFNLITFSGDTHILFPQPVPATPDNVRRAQELLDSRHGGGGTEMMKAIRAALDPSDAQDHIRVVAFLTDGYVGNDMEIIAEVQKHTNARVFAFGIGGSVNRFLLDKMAEYGRGEVEYVGLRDDGSKAARRFFERVRNPLLTNLSLDTGGLPVTDLFPARLPDLFSAKPVVIHGRYTSASSGVFKIRGQGPKGPVELSLKVNLPAAELRNDSLASIWARTKIDDLMGRFYSEIQRGQPPLETKEEIVKLGLAFRLVTQYTSFIAVDEQTITEGGRPRRIQVPLEMPEGVSYEGVYGKQAADQAFNGPQMALRSTVGSGSFGGFLPGRMRQEPTAPLVNPTPHPPASQPQKLSAGVQTQLAKWKASQLPPRKLDIQIVVAAASPAVLQQLRDTGFELLSQAPGSRILIGRISIDRLDALTALDAVRSVM